MNGEDLRGNYHQPARKLKMMYQNKYQKRLEKTYKETKVQSKIWNDINDSGKNIDNFNWIRLNIPPEKVGQIVRIQEQMIPIKIFLHMQRKHQETIICRLCQIHTEGTLYWMSSCPYLTSSEYLKKHRLTKH